MATDTDAERLAKRLFRRYSFYGYAVVVTKLVGAPCTPQSVHNWRRRMKLAAWAVEPVRALLEGGVTDGD